MAKSKKTGKKPGKQRGSKGAAKAKVYRAVAAKRRSALAPKKSVKKVAKVPEPKVSAKASKKADEHTRKAEQLMDRGRQRGFVTYDEILKAFPNIETDVDFLEDLYERFSTAHIDVLEGGGMLEIADEPNEKGYSRSDSSYDSIQMYLREIGKYPLLNAQQEREIGRAHV